jgi:hypothetical protein
VYVNLILENHKFDFFSMKSRLFHGLGCHLQSIKFEIKQTTRGTFYLSVPVHVE